MTIAKSCYIAGPMRGIPAYNYPAFMAAAKLLCDLGWMVYNPAAMDIEAEPEEDYTTFTLEQQELHNTASNIRGFAIRDINVILRKLRAENGDAVFVLPDWENSKGARAETAMAEWVMIPVIPIAEATR